MAAEADCRAFEVGGADGVAGFAAQGAAWHILGLAVPETYVAAGAVTPQQAAA